MKANPRFFVFEDPRERPYGNPEAFREVNAAVAEKETDKNELVLVVEVDQTAEGIEAHTLSFLGADWFKHPEFNIKVTSFDNDLTKAMLKAIAAAL